jgi:hypothetical protein
MLYPDTSVSFITPSHTQTMMGKALHSASASSRVNDRFQEPLYLVLELLRAGVVHGQKWGGPDAEVLSGGPSFGSDEDQSSTLLIMRVMSILPLIFRVSAAQKSATILTTSLASTMGRTLVARAASLQLVCPSIEQVSEAVAGSGNDPHLAFRRRQTPQG